MVRDIRAKAKRIGQQLARIGPLVRFDLVRSQNLLLRLTIECGATMPHLPFLPAGYCVAKGERPGAASPA
jgi:hypothetical protein